MGVCNAAANAHCWQGWRWQQTAQGRAQWIGPRPHGTGICNDQMTMADTISCSTYVKACADTRLWPEQSTGRLKWQRQHQLQHCEHDMSMKTMEACAGSCGLHAHGYAWWQVPKVWTTCAQGMQRAIGKVRESGATQRKLQYRNLKVSVDRMRVSPPSLPLCQAGFEVLPVSLTCGVSRVAPCVPSKAGHTGRGNGLPHLAED